ERLIDRVERARLHQLYQARYLAKQVRYRIARIDELVGAAREELLRAGIADEVVEAAGKVDRQETWIDVARLADDGAEYLIVIHAEAGAYDGGAAVAAEQIGRLRETDARREVVAVGRED